MKLLSFKNHRFIVVFELSDFCVIVLEVLKSCLRVFDNCGLKELSVKAFSVAEGFRELELGWDRRRRVRRHGSKIDVT